ncbi:hypothetical protein D3C76_1458970 [compost metagenome]
MKHQNLNHIVFYNFELQRLKIMSDLDQGYLNTYREYDLMLLHPDAYSNNVGDQLKLPVGGLPKPALALAGSIEKPQQYSLLLSLHSSYERRINRQSRSLLHKL